MMDETKNAAAEETEEVPVTEEAAEPAAEAPAEEPKAEEIPQPDPVETLKAQLAAEHDNYLRLAAEYDNFRKRTQKEKDNMYMDGRVDAVGKFLPVFDNLQRALAQETTDAAYKKGVEMTMNGLLTIMEGLNVKPFGQAGDAFDPTMHNAVMHIEDENLGENVIADVFQTGFKVGDRVVRFAMVKVAN